MRAAVDRLPPAQRQALSLAFFDDLSHDQVAVALKLPVGTVKTRIRSAVHKLRFMLAPLGVAAVAVAVLVGGGIRFELQRLSQARTDRALSPIAAGAAHGFSYVSAHTQSSRDENTVDADRHRASGKEEGGRPTRGELADDPVAAAVRSRSGKLRGRLLLANSGASLARRGAPPRGGHRLVRRPARPVA